MCNMVWIDEPDVIQQSYCGPFDDTEDFHKELFAAILSSTMDSLRAQGEPHEVVSELTLADIHRVEPPPNCVYIPSSEYNQNNNNH